MYNWDLKRLNSSHNLKINRSHVNILNYLPELMLNLNVL